MLNNRKQNSSLQSCSDVWCIYTYILNITYMTKRCSHWAHRTLRQQTARIADLPSILYGRVCITSAVSQITDQFSLTCPPSASLTPYMGKELVCANKGGNAAR